MARRPVWLTDEQIEVALGYVAELLDDQSEITNATREVFDDIYEQLSKFED